MTTKNKILIVLILAGLSFTTIIEAQTGVGVKAPKDATVISMFFRDVT